MDSRFVRLHCDALHDIILAYMLAQNARNGDICLNFKGFEPLNLHIEVLRGLMKSLKDRELVRHYTNLMHDDGTFAGAGYSLTPAGAARAERCKKIDDDSSLDLFADPFG